MERTIRPDDYVGRAERYARAVVAGEIVAGKWAKAACKRYLDDLQRTDWQFEFDPERAAKPCKLLELLPHVKGFTGTIRGEDFQFFILCSLFGWVDKRTRLRRFRQAYIEMARKNAKSTLAAVIAIYMLAFDGEAGAEVYSAATTREQARIVFETARGMVVKTPKLRELGLEPGQHAIVGNDGATFKPLSADAQTLDGLNPHCAIVDELHAHKTRHVWDVLVSATGARRQPLTFAITTAGSDQSGICYEVRDYVAQVLTATIDGKGHKDESLFGIIYTIDDGDDFQDEITWRKANPNLGVSVNLEYLRGECKQAIAVPSKAANFKTKHLDVWVNADQAWLDSLAWSQCAQPGLDIEDFEGRTCYLGLDLALKNDLCALAFIFPEGEQLTVFAKSFLPERKVELAPHWMGWRESGHLIETGGDTIDYDVIYEEIRAAVNRFNVQALAYDVAHAGFFIRKLQNDGVLSDQQCIEIPQRASGLSEAMKELEKRILERKLEHADDPCLNWQMSNVVAKLDNMQNMRPVKETDSKKIDAAVAIITAQAAAMRMEQDNEFIFWRASA